MRRRSTTVLVVASLFAWLAGSAIGTTIPVATAQAAPYFDIGLAHPTENLPSLTGNKPIFFLVLGSGARPPQPYTRGLADSIHVIGYNPQTHKAVILGIPRDSWVPLVTGGTNKINAAMAYGGPTGMVKEIEQVTGIHIDYYAVTSFDGFKSAVSMVGGVTVPVPYSGGMVDHNSGANFTKGKHHLTGAQALAYSRDRDSVPNGDFSRSCDGGIMLLSLLTQYQKQFQTNPSILLTYLAAGIYAASSGYTPNVTTNIPYNQLLTMGFTATQVPPKNVELIVAPGAIGHVGAISTVNLLPTDKAGVFADIAQHGYMTKNWKGSFGDTTAGTGCVL